MRVLRFSVILVSTLFSIAEASPLHPCIPSLRAAGIYVISQDAVSVHSTHRMAPLVVAIHQMPEPQRSEILAQLLDFVLKSNRSTKGVPGSLVDALKTFDLVEDGRVSESDFYALRRLASSSHPERYLHGEVEGPDLRSSNARQHWGRYYYEVARVHRHLIESLQEYGLHADTQDLDPNVYTLNKNLNLYLDPHTGQIEGENALGVIFSAEVPMGLLTPWGYIPIYESGTQRKNMSDTAISLEDYLTRSLGLEEVAPEVHQSFSNIDEIRLGPIFQITRGPTGHRFQSPFRLRDSSQYLEPLGRTFDWHFLELPAPWKSPD